MFWTVVLEKALQSPLDSKKIKPVNPKGNQPWIFIWRMDAEAPVLWPSDAKSWLIGKYLGAEKNWGQEKKEVTENEMVGWNHWLSGRKFEQTSRDCEGQGSLVCCSPWGPKLDTTEWLNDNFGSTWGWVLPLCSLEPVICNSWELSSSQFTHPCSVEEQA